MRTPEDDESYWAALSMRTKLFKHQTKAVSLMRDKDAFALLMEMGTGKSLAILAEFEQQSKFDNLLVLAKAGSYRNWLDEIDIHMDKKPSVAIWKSNNKKLRSQCQELIRRNGKRVLLVNIEALSSIKEARNLCAKFLQSGRSIMVVDESTTIKLISTKRTKAALYLGQFAERRRILSGLATPKSPLDLFSQMKFLDPRIFNIESWAAFRMHYAVVDHIDFGGRMLAPVIRKDRKTGQPMFRNLDEMKQRIAPYSYRVLKKDCLDLPPKVFESRDIELTAQQKKIYADLKKMATAEIEKGKYITATMVITQIIRLHQVLCGYAVDEAGKHHEVETNRDTELLEILDEHEGKAIIWSTYDFSIRKIGQLLTEKFGKESVAMFWGKNASTRAEDEKRWKSDPNCRFLISTQAAGSMGNNWMQADLVIYHSNSYDLEHRIQSEDRAHRSGQTKSVVYCDLIARGTVDELIIKALRNKIDLATVITGENYREWLI